MRRVTLMMAAVAMMVSLFAVAAYAAEIKGTGNDDWLNESQRNDQIAGKRSGDTINAAFYEIDETPLELGDKDKVKGNRGDDIIYADDGDFKDIANGGPGDDTCYIDETLTERDETLDCEAIIRNTP
jgi:Ca2+-binding RTX toxin-like protein